MDWLRSALNEDTSSDSECSEYIAETPAEASNASTEIQESSKSSEDKDGHIAHTNVEDVTKEAYGASTLYGDVEGSQDQPPLNDISSSSRPAPEPLFSLTTSRKPETYSKDEIIRINVPQLSEEDLREIEAPSQNNLSHDDNDQDLPEMQQEDDPTSRQQGSLDTLEIMQSFNMIHGGSKIKPPKQRDWFGSNIRVTDIKAEDLRMSKTEKSARYSTSKVALLEGRTAFQAPVRRLETDDGQLLTTNVMRKTSKRKHQISWLAADAQERELELLEKTAQSRKTKHETQMKYGW